MTHGAAGLPEICKISASAPFEWLAGAWSDLRKAPGAFLAYGVGITSASLWISLTLLASGASLTFLALTAGFVFAAPMLAMGLYEAGRLIEAGERPSLTRMLFAPPAFSRDIAYLGLVLLFIYLLWGKAAQIVYALSTSRLHRTLADLADFAIATDAGRGMLVTGTIIGGVIAFLTFCLVVVSIPMLLDRRADAFTAMITSTRAVLTNFWPMMIWATLIAVLIAASAATVFLGLIVVFPWLGLASWRAYRAVVGEFEPPNRA